MARLYASPVVFGLFRGRGEPAYFAAIANKAGVRRCRSMIASQMTGAERGKPQFNWAVCFVEADDWAAVDADTSLIHIDDALLDSAPPNNLKVRLRNAGVATNAELNSVTTIRELLRLLVQKHYPYADETALVP